MKRLFPLLFLLLTTWASFAQGVQNIRVRANPNPGPVLYNVQVTRDLTQFPIPSGSNSFTTAVATRVLAATVTCPCGERPVIAAGQPFPLTAPCSDNCTTTPSWASSWYDYNGSVLTVRATGDDMLLRFERQDGQAFTTTNPDNVQLNNLTFYDHATFNNGALYQWQINFQNAPPMRLTYKRKSDNSIYQLNFTPATGASNVQLFQASSGGGGTGCDYTLAVNSPTISCSGTAYLTATASGTAATGLSYSWTGPNSYTASGASVAVNLAQSGTFLYTVTANKTGCSPKQASATVTVTGCSSQTVTTPGYGNVWAANSIYQPIPTNSPSGSGELNGFYNRIYIQNGNGIKVGANMRLGGVIDFVGHPNWYDLKNVISSPKWDNGNVDGGRQLGIATYEWPHKVYHDPVSGQTSETIGYQPVEGGNEGNRGEYSLLVTAYRDNNKIYTRTQPNQWQMSMVRARLYIDKWITFDPNDQNAFRVHNRLINFRNDPDSEHFPTSDRTHDMPYFMLTSEFDQVWYNQGGKPYEGAWTGRSQPENPSGGGTAFYASEPCIAAIKTSTGKGFGLYAPISARFSYNNDRKGTDFGYDYQFPTFFMGAAPFLILDKNGIYDLDWAVKYGTVEEIRNWCLAQPRWSGTFDYQFNSHSRYNFWYHNCGDQLEANITDGLIIKPLFDNENNGRDMKVNIQETWVNGRVVKHIYIRGAFTGPSNSMTIVFKKSGQSNLNAEYYHNVTIQNDGVERTYDIDMSGDPNWNNQDIVTFGLSYAPSYPTVDSNTQWIIKRISSTNF